MNWLPLICFRLDVRDQGADIHFSEMNRNTTWQKSPMCALGPLRKSSLVARAVCPQRAVDFVFVRQKASFCRSTSAASG